MYEYIRMSGIACTNATETEMKNEEWVDNDN